MLLQGAEPRRNSVNEQIYQPFSFPVLVSFMDTIFLSHCHLSLDTFISGKSEAAAKAAGDLLSSATTIQDIRICTTIHALIALEIIVSLSL